MGAISKAQVKLVRQLQQKKYRDELSLFVAEGDKCIGELMPYFPLYLRADSSNATSLELEQMSSLRSPQGVIAVFRQGDRPADETLQPADSLVLALDGVQDPGNLGTIIRTCDWFGIRHIYCSRQTADCFNPKVVQATMGALGRVQLHYVDLEAYLRIQREAGISIYGTLLEGRNCYEAGAIADRQRGVIVMGNEGNGLTEGVRRLVSHPLLIPAYTNNETPDHVESLNVSIATAVILSEFRRGMMA